MPDALILALDTTTRGGSVAIARGGRLLDVHEGPAARPHGERLPGDITTLLARHGLTVRDVDVYAVATGPGSFTGLRVGIAAVQGLALTHGRRVAAISALDALARIAAVAAGDAMASGDRIGAWMDAQRGEVFAAWYEPGAAAPAAGPAVGRPEECLAAWAPRLADRRVWFAGNGAIAWRGRIAAALGDRARILEPLPPLAPALAGLAAAAVREGRTVAPHAIVPLYVRRPDAELARRRPRGDTG